MASDSSSRMVATVNMEPVALDRLTRLRLLGWRLVRPLFRNSCLRSVCNDATNRERDTLPSQPHVAHRAHRSANPSNVKPPLRGVLDPPVATFSRIACALCDASFTRRLTDADACLPGERPFCGGSLVW